MADPKQGAPRGSNHGPEPARLRLAVPVLPSADIARDTRWYETHAGFRTRFADRMYAGLTRDDVWLHLQWHADTADDPLLGGSVVRLFVPDITPALEEFVARGTIGRDALRRDTAWGTHEFGFKDLNENLVFIVQDTDTKAASAHAHG